ncbi:MAG: hypothetical protein ACW9W3_09870 [Candidatus Nitrosopumilus sp. bin_68KS]
MNLLKDNPNEHLNPDFNTALTQWTNTLGHVLTQKETKVVKLGYKINVLSGRVFDYTDFKDIVNHNYFRVIVCKLKPIFILENKSDKAYYRLQGLYTDKKLTQWYTDTSENNRIFGTLDQLLSLIKHRPAMIHDIHIDTKTSNLYNSLLQSGHKPNPDNKKIIIPLKNNPLVDSHVRLTLIVTSKDTLTFTIGCTFNPIPYDASGFAKLFDILGQMKTILKINAGNNFQICPVYDYHMRYFHFNKDSLEYNFPPGFTLNLVYNHVQIYQKKLDTGKSVIRYEEKKKDVFLVK